MVTRGLAALAISYRYETLPPEVRAMAVRCILDTTACAIAGRGERAAVLVREEAIDQGGKAESSLLGSSVRLPAGQAALANGTAAHVLDYDDVNVAIPGHATAVVMPAVVALGEAINASGRDVIAAFVAGYEVACRVGLLVAPGHYERGYHATATTGVVGAAAACANLLRLTPAQATSALALAATQAGGLKAMFGNHAKPMHAGMAARNGILAARLAAGGFDAGDDAIEHAQGFARVLSPDFKPEDALDAFTFHILRNLFKYHAACYGVHAAIECASQLRARIGARDTIASVRVTSNPASERYCNISSPVNAAETKFSLRLNAAFGFLGRDTSRLDAYSDTSAADGEATALRDRVTVGFSEDLAMMKSTVEVETASGAKYSVTHDAGQPEADLAAQARRVAAKFTALVEPVIGAGRAEALKQRILALDSLTMAQCAPWPA
ncbi:MAG: MmgE/PrpD family protein [Usitatibacter sp.]